MLIDDGVDGGAERGLQARQGCANESRTVSAIDGAKQLRMATYASVTTAAVLIAIKLAAWRWTGSVSILASLVDSLMDGIASMTNLVAVRYSLRPPDEEHRFGHGKAEPLAGLAQSAFIGASAVFLVVHAVDRLRYPAEVQHVTIGIGVMTVAIALTTGLLMIQRSVIQKTQSTAIRADALHYGADLLANFSVILALLLARYGWSWADPVMAIGVAAYVFYGATRIAFDAFQHLMDRELPAQTQERILAIACQSPRVRGAHDLRTRRSGQTRFVQLHLELDQELTFAEAHAISAEIENKIRAVVPNAQIIIHQDPVSDRQEGLFMKDPNYAFTKKLEGVSVEEAVDRVTRALKAHGFGVLTKIDIQRTLKDKLGEEFRPYVILGACNPTLAHKALQGEPHIGLLLPCNVVVQETEGGALVSFADPKAMFELAPDAPIGDVAAEARRLLEAARDQL